MRNIIILIAFATLANSGEVELPSRVIRAEEEYKEQVERERQKLLQTIDREINRLRLDEDEKKLAEKIVAEEDEDVRKALLSVASNSVKMSLALIEKKKDYEVERDMLGNVVGVNNPGARSMVGKWHITKTSGWDKTLIISEDNTVVASNGLNGKLSIQDGKVFIRWDGGKMWESVNLPIADEMSGDAWDGKDTVRLIKIKE
jgi:hypothetical protein